MMDCWELAVCWGDPLSFTVRTTVNVPADEYVWVVDDPVPVVPSPKFQLQVAVPTPPVVGAMKSTRAPTSVRFGLAATVTVNFALTVSETLLAAVTPRP